jgi:hypothetical protein
MDHLNSTVRWRQVSQLFTRPMISAIAREGSVRPVRALMRKAGMDVAKDASVASLLDECLNGLRENYRCEYVYKAALGDRIVFGRHSPRTASLHVELPVERSIVDIAVFNGTSTAYEIKTELDSDKRLVSQTPDYLRVFDRVYVVTHPTLVDRYIRVLDERVGLLALTSRGRLTTVRVATNALDRIDTAALFRMMRRAEYQAAIARICGPQPILPAGLLFQHYSRLWATLTVVQSHEAFVDAMRARTTGPDTVEFLSNLPASLRVLGYSTPLSGVQRDRLLCALS